MNVWPTPSPGTIPRGGAIESAAKSTNRCNGNCASRKLAPGRERQKQNTIATLAGQVVALARNSTRYNNSVIDNNRRR